MITDKIEKCLRKAFQVMTMYENIEFIMDDENSIVRNQYEYLLEKYADALEELRKSLNQAYEEENNAPGTCREKTEETDAI